MDNRKIQDNNNLMSNLERIKILKKKADEMSQEYHENIEKLKIYDKDVDFMIRKIGTMDQKLEKILDGYK